MDMWIPHFIELLILASPYLLVDMVAVILALLWWRRHPRTSLLTLLAIGLSVAVAVLGGFMLAFLPDYLYGFPGIYDRSFEEKRFLTRMIMLVRNVLGALAYGLLVVAVFSGRPEKTLHYGLSVDSGDSPC
jgi:hypothetical protein